MPTTPSPERRPVADWTQDEIDHERVRSSVILDALLRGQPVTVTAPALLDRAAQALTAARRAESPA